MFKIYRLINWSFPEFYTFSDCGQTLFDGLICVFFSPWSAANKKFSTFLNEYTSVKRIQIHKSVSLVSYSDCVQVSMFLIQKIYYYLPCGWYIRRLTLSVTLPFWAAEPISPTTWWWDELRTETVSTAIISSPLNNRPSRSAAPPGTIWPIET